MHLINLKSMQASPYNERLKNVLYKTDTFKLRVIELKAGEKLPPDGPCVMESYVIFYILSGKIGITINEEYNEAEDGFCVVAEPGSYRLETQTTSKILGIQIEKPKAS